jgi:putative redox protein
MKVLAHRRTSDSYQHDISIREHVVAVDEPPEFGGDDAGPDPQELLAASLASCTAVTMEMYARRKGWDIGLVEVQVAFQPAERGCPTRFELIMRFPDTLSNEQIERLRTIAAKCPVHRALDGEVMFDERIEVLSGAH